MKPFDPENIRKLAVAVGLSLTLCAFAEAQEKRTSGDQPYRVPWAKPVEFPDDGKPAPESVFFPKKPGEKTERVPAPPDTDPGDVDAEPPFKNARFSKFAPKTTYKRGSEGPAVLALQNALLDLGFGLPAGADGKYGGQTEDAVVAFQSSQKLEQTGVFDLPTLRAIDSVAPPLGKKIWEDAPAAKRALPPAPSIGDKKCRGLIMLSQFRLVVYKKDGTPERVFPLACGAEKTPTHPGNKIVVDHLADPTALAWKLWPDSKGQAFGKRLIDLSWYDPGTDTIGGSDEELHGTFETNSIGSQASHGCMRFHNDHIEWLYENLKVGDLVLVSP